MHPILPFYLTYRCPNSVKQSLGKSLGQKIPLQSCKLRARKKYVLIVALVEKVKTNTCKKENGVLTSHPFQMEFGSTLFPKSSQKKKQTNKHKKCSIKIEN